MTSKRKAFTIVEFLLAMSFIGTMLVGIAALTIRITNIYQKGLSVRSINSTGREIVADLIRTINASRVNVDINPALNSKNEATIKAINAVRADYFVETKNDTKQLGGAFCTGTYSYVWNTAENFRTYRTKFASGITSDYQAKTATDNYGIYVLRAMNGKKNEYLVPRFARFIDRERFACEHDTAYNPSTATGNTMKENKYLFYIGDEKTLNDVTELIQDGEQDLVIYNFTALPATQHRGTKQIFYSGMFILATYRGGINIKANGDFCSGSSNDDGSPDTEVTMYDFDYCAVNKFNFSARATGETGIKNYGDQ